MYTLNILVNIVHLFSNANMVQIDKNKYFYIVFSLIQKKLLISSEVVWYHSFQLFDGDIIHTFVNPAALYICHLVDEPELRLTRTSKDRNQDIFVTTRTSIR